jgi:hypothetical protein
MPTTLDPEEILLGLNNGPGIYLAPTGTVAPADTTTAWADPWEPLGYLSDDGVTLGSSTESDSLTPWQSTAPVRNVITGKELTLQFVMWQTNPQSMALWFDITRPAAPVAGEELTFDIRSDSGGNLYAVGLDISDQGIVTRVVFPRAQVGDTGDVSVTRGDAIGWDVTLTALDDAGVLAHVLQSAPDVDPGSGETQRKTKSDRVAA